MKYCFGIDIGGTTVKMGLFQEDGELLDKWEIKTRTENQGEAILPDIAQAVKAKMAEKKLVKEQIIGLGMGLPAPVTEDGIVQNTANLGWGYKEVTRELEELLDGMKVIPGNDANVAALGEMWKGGGKGHKNVIMVTRGWKVPCRGTRCWRRDRSFVCKLPGDRNLWMWKERLSGTVCFCNRNHKTCQYASCKR